MKNVIKIILLLVVFLNNISNVFAQNKTSTNRKPDIEFTLNAYSFSDLLLAKDSRDKQPVYSYFNLLDWCAANQIKGIDLTGYFFPGYPEIPSDEYLANLKQYCAKLGITITGTGIRNNFASPNPAIRAADVALAKKWLPVAAKLGAPVLRLFAGEIPKGYENKWDEVAGWMIQCYKEVAVEAEKYQVVIGIQNHGDMLQTAEQCFKVVKGVDSKWAGLITDIGNFKTPDPYKDIEAVVPITVNWQIKESVFGIGNTTVTDYKRLMEITKKQGYKGFMPIETLLVRGVPYDPFKLVLQMKREMETARDAVYKSSYAQNEYGKGFAFEQNARLGRGVNIIGYDPLWRDSTKARMKQSHFKLIKEAGFNHVRIVISPFKFSLNDTGFTIDKKFFTTLDWAIKSALKNNLLAIVDFHEHGAMGKDPIGNKPKLLAMWKQIAEHCKGYSLNVLFEICNEPNMKPDLWNGIHSEAFQILRKSNPNRTIIIGTINGNQIKHLNDLILPENDRNIIVAIHYYSPIQFTHQGAPWSVKNKDLSGIEWKQTMDEEAAVKLDFDMAQQWSKTYNRPLTLGEFGAYEKADMNSRIRWTNFIARQAEERKWSWSYWQFDSDFIVYNMEQQVWVEPIKNALIPKK